MSSYARAVLYHVSQVKGMVDEEKPLPGNAVQVASKDKLGEIWPRYEDTVFLMNSEPVYWNAQSARGGVGATNSSFLGDHSFVGFQHDRSYSQKVVLLFEK